MPIAANQAGGGSFAPAAEETQTMTVSPKPGITLTLSGPTTLIAGKTAPATFTAVATGDAPLSGSINIQPPNGSIAPAVGPCQTTGAGTTILTTTCTSSTFTIGAAGSYIYTARFNQNGSSAAADWTVVATKPSVTVSLAAVYTATQEQVGQLIAARPEAITFIAIATGDVPILQAIGINPISGPPGSSGPTLGPCTTSGMGTTVVTTTCPKNPFTLPTAGNYVYQANVLSPGGGSGTQTLTLNARIPIVNLSFIAVYTGTQQLVGQLISGKPENISFIATATSESPLTLPIHPNPVNGPSGQGPYPQYNKCTTTGVGTMSVTTVCPMDGFGVSDGGTYIYQATATAQGQGTNTKQVTLSVRRPIVTVAFPNANNPGVVAGQRFTDVTLTAVASSESPGLTMQMYIGGSPITGCKFVGTPTSGSLTCTKRVETGLRYQFNVLATSHGQGQASATYIFGPGTQSENVPGHSLSEDVGSKVVRAAVHAAALARPTPVALPNAGAALRSHRSNNSILMRAVGRRGFAPLG
jgi:hypothetical protein